MNSLYPLPNQVGSLSTKTIETLAHHLSVGVFGISQRKTTSVPSKFLLSNPSTFAANGSHPYLGFSSSMNDRKRPLSIEFKNIVVGNKFSSKWIYDFNHILAQNKFGSYPNQVGACAEYETKQDFEKSLSSVSDNENAVNSKKNNQNKGHASPHKVTTRTESFIHVLSIAGERK